MCRKIAFVACLFLIPAVAADPDQDAGRTVCNNEDFPEDIWISPGGFGVGVDTDLTGQGFIVCVGTGEPPIVNIGVGFDYDPPMYGTGIVIEVLICHEQEVPCDRALDDTGYYHCGGLRYHIVIDGNGYDDPCLG